MATQWYWRKGEESGGPISFQELASLVRDRTLNEDDFARPHYSRDWQSTDSIVGLFYMAGREPLPKETVILEEVQQDSSADVDQLETESREGFRRLEEFETKQSAAFGCDQGSNGHAAGVLDQQTLMTGDQSDPGEPVEPLADGQMAAAIAAASDDWDRRHSQPQEPAPADSPNPTMGLTAWVMMIPWLTFSVLFSIIRAILNPLITLLFLALAFLGRTLRVQLLCRYIERIASRQTLSWSFRIGSALAVGGIMGFAILSWSDYEDLRYPDAQRIAAGKRSFPIFGPCLPAEFTFLLADAILAGSAIGYFGARWMELLSED